MIGASLIVGILLGLVGCSDASPAPAVQTTAFEPASGTYFADDRVVSSLRFKNTGDDRRTFWVGYSVQDSLGRWHDVPAGSVELNAGKESEVQEKSWSVPEDDPPVSGAYNVKMSVWDAQPDEGGASRLASAEKTSAFTVLNFEEDFGSLGDSRWRVTSKKLGLGSLEPENVSAESGRLKLKLPADTFDGGEIESRELYLYGTYRARIKVADAPSSITGFFLYKEPDFENEIDIEIFNDSTGRILFTTYSGGEQTNTVRRELPFDPTADFHDYRFDLYPDKAEFYVDGDRMHSFDKGLPKKAMKLQVNAWYPTWLSGEKPDADGYTYVDQVRH
ncbi:hypothetical protein BH24ACT21_BH24ACT21_10670 [soil metagenome]